MKRNPTQTHQRHDTHAAALRAPDSPVRGILNRLTKVAPPPLDCGGLLAFCVGTSALIDIGQRLLKEPAPEFLMLQGECQTLAAACIARFEAAGQADAEGAFDEYKTSHPAWAAVVAAGKGHADVTLGCVRNDAAATLWQSEPFGPAQAGLGQAHRIVYGATYSAANKAMYLATSKVADADLGTIFEVDKGVADADLCKARPVVTALVTGLADVPSTRIIALKSGALIYGTANGKLMLLDPTAKTVALVADLRTGNAAASAVRGYLTEASDNVVVAIVHDHDAAGANTARRLVSVDVGTARQSSRDVGKLISETEPYPGVMRLN
jgi:hypothetical protein